MSRARRFMFTIFLTESEIDSVCENVRSWGVYGGAQLEICPETGRLHLQGFVCFDRAMRMSALKRLHATAHWETMRGTLEDAEKYCSKEESRMPGKEPFKWGTRPAQGKRSDLADACDVMRNARGGARRRLDALIEAAPDVYVKYMRGLEALARHYAHETPGFAFQVPRVWQLALEKTLQSTPDDRSIVWICDPVGGSGKSSFIRYYLTKYPGSAAVLAGKVADMAYMWEADYGAAFFDLTRTQAEQADHLYSFAESLKNGILVSSKYESRLKLFSPPHVIFFSNGPPSPGKWSLDRLRYYEISSSNAFCNLVEEGTEVPDIFGDRSYESEVPAHFNPPNDPTIVMH